MRLTILLCLLLFLACLDDATMSSLEEEKSVIAIRATDLSALPEIEQEEIIFYNKSGDEEDMLTTLKNNGVNTVRLKLWHQPENEHASFDEVKIVAERIRLMGMNVWLTVHYSDTWADPAHQQLPALWSNLSYDELKDSVANCTARIVTEIQPEFIQIGNEINNGFLFPHASLNSNENQFKGLLTVATNAIRVASSDSKIILHFAGINGAVSFFDKMKTIDYDIIGLSYYPIWHGKDLSILEETILELNQFN